MKYINIFLILAFMILEEIKGDIPCEPKFYTNKSSVCVCNSTYCDTVTREQPAAGTFITYTSSKAGLRFSKSTNNITTVTNSSDCDYGNYTKVIRLQPNRTYQTIEGFGGAVTDAAGINLMSLPTDAQQRLIDSYFSEDGIEYNMLRVPIGSSDFSTSDYTYCTNENNLTNFNLSTEDFNIKIPFIQKCQKAATADLHVVSAVWSPPLWMRTANNNTVIIDEKYYQDFADYHCKFAEMYKENNITIWGMSASNEPLTQLAINISYTEIFWTARTMGKFVSNYFGPTIRNCSVSGIKILANDDQRHYIPVLFSQLLRTNSSVMQYIDGVASHFYSDKLSPPATASYALEAYPDKFIISTEACLGTGKDVDVDLGSWDRAEAYITDIMENLNYNYVGWLDWNMCLDTLGGPSWANNAVDSLIIVDAENEQFYKQPMFYGMGHFTKFLPRGSKRIRDVTLVPQANPDLDIVDIELLRLERFDHVSFMTPRETIVVIIHNEGSAQNMSILIDNQQVPVLLEAASITTVEVPYSNSTI